MRCVVWGCQNEVVREFVHKIDATLSFGLCAFHGQAIIKHGTDEQVNSYVFPNNASGGKPWAT